MTPEKFIHEFDALSTEDKKRVMMAIGPAICREFMSHPDMMKEMWRWCESFVVPAEMKDMMQRMMEQRPAGSP